MCAEITAAIKAINVACNEMKWCNVGALKLGWPWWPEGVLMGEINRGGAPSRGDEGGYRRGHGAAERNHEVPPWRASSAPPW